MFASFPFPVLVADIGGTNARFALIETPADDYRLLPQIATASAAGVAEAIRRAAFATPGPRPKTAIMAIAGPITGDRVPLTNCPWVIEPKRLIAEFGFDSVVLINDFEAQALALPHLGPADVVTLGGGSVRPDATKAVVGPGTGLGVGILVHSEGRWIPVPGEGGHVTLAPESAREAAIWPHLVAVPDDGVPPALSRPRITGESVLSGQGLENLHRAILACDGRPPADLTAAEISRAAGAGDAAAIEAFHLFAAGLGRLAGDLALTVLPRGGVYIGGGISPKNLPFLTDGIFRAAFEAKAPHRARLAEIATAVVVHSHPAMVGLAGWARHPDRFVVDLDGRHWTAAGA
ncbi:glucokinase [Siculibacillus lacustris]|uniref:Glucokinase n=1 Tax=Siculibacillus lacustris TaxID=1549641 RepID=A0A4V6MZ41_9HYPH|nr:glucokinase [Siculibacillus lacustris]TBW39245.1 glucokinase [Siculibacillus lacustris]